MAPPASGRRAARRARRLSRRHGEHRADQRGLRRRVRRRTVAPCAGPQRRSGRVALPTAALRPAPAAGRRAAVGAAMSATRVYFADVDGSGAADIVYAAVDHLLVFRNQSGNGYSAPLRVPLPLRLSPTDQISFSDIRGNGTIVITRVSPEVEHWACDLCADPVAPESGGKPLSAGVDRQRPGRDHHAAVRQLHALLSGGQAGRTPLGRAALPRAGGHGGAQRRCGLPGVIHAALRLSRRLLRSGGAAVPWLRHGGELGRAGLCALRRHAGRQLADGARGRLRVPPTRIRTWYCLGAYELAPAVAARTRARISMATRRRRRR